MAMGKPDTNDVNYDAYLVNDRTLADPEVVRRREKRARTSADYQRKFRHQFFR